MVFGPDDALYVSSRFEGVVYRVAPDGGADPFVGEVGVACGLAFDRGGRVVRRRPIGDDLPGAPG